MADPTQKGDLIDFEPHARSSSKTKTAAGQLVLDLLLGHPEPGGQPFDNDDERLPVRFSCGQEAQHEVQPTRVTTIGRDLRCRSVGVEGVLADRVVGDVNDLGEFRQLITKGYFNALRQSHS
jgi:hypothetical protein